MKLKILKIAGSALAVTILLFTYRAEAVTAVSGGAELSYVDYNSKSDQQSFSGNTFAQRYSLAWSASNLYYRSQPRYYDVTLGYDLLSFDTNVKDGLQHTNIKDTFGKLRYNGSVGYTPPNLPVRFTAYADDGNALQFKRSIGQNPLVDDALIYNIDGQYRAESYGASFVFDPNQARDPGLRGLPRLHLDYKEKFTKSLSGVYLIDNKSKEIAVAGLSKDNNWIQFRSWVFEDRLNVQNNFTQQQIQIGLVDYNGRRLWSSLTNWIEVSADGQLTTRKSVDGFEEYDINFMAVATRRTWDAKTFMNYNRMMDNKLNYAAEHLTESVRLPLYIKGIYGAETDWHASFSTEQVKQTGYFPSLTSKASSNSVAVGGTTFTRSKFTLSPSLSVSSAKGSDGVENLNVAMTVETNSTARFSSSLGLGARNSFNYRDDGYNTQTSKTWSDTLTLAATHRPSNTVTYSLQEDLEVGESVPLIAAPGFTGLKSYLRSNSVVKASWIPTASFSNTFELSYDKRVYESSRSTSQSRIDYRIMYDRQETFYRLDTAYQQKDDLNGKSWALTNTGDVQYRPDRYNDAILRYTYSKANDGIRATSKLDLLQRYTYNLFTRTGVVRNLAKLTEEIGYNSIEYGGRKTSSYYLLLSGRYAPTERLSLYGSAKYANSNPSAATFVYNAGLNADFKLLSTSLEYAYAKRDLDNRIEKRFGATVRRIF